MGCAQSWVQSILHLYLVEPKTMQSPGETKVGKNVLNVLKNRGTPKTFRVKFWNSVPFLSPGTYRYTCTGTPSISFIIYRWTIYVPIFVFVLKIFVYCNILNRWRTCTGIRVCSRTVLLHIVIFFLLQISLKWPTCISGHSLLLGKEVKVVCLFGQLLIVSIRLSLYKVMEH